MNDKRSNLPPRAANASLLLPDGSGGEAGVQETPVPSDDLGTLVKSGR
jgi:hypothetical protein